MTFEEFWPTYERKKTLQVKKTTLAAYRLSWESHLREYFGPIDMDQVKNSTFQRYVDDRLLGGASAKSIQDQVIVVKNMLKLWSLEQDKPNAVFTIIWPTAQSRKPQKPREKFTDKEVSQLVEYAKTSKDHFDKFVALAAMSGTRIGELCGLKFGDFDYKEKSIHIRRTVGRIYNGKGETELYENTPKTVASNRIVPIPGWLCSYFKSYQGLFNLSDEEYITAAITGATPFLEPRTVRCKFYRLCDKVGIRRLPFHSLRHTYASRLLLARTDIRTTAELLGHGDVDTTLNIYAHSDEEKKRLAAKKIFL